MDDDDALESFLVARREAFSREFEAVLMSEAGKEIVEQEIKHQREKREALEVEISKKGLSKEMLKKERVRIKFEFFDVDGSGTLDHIEFSSLVRSLCIPMNDDQIKNAYRDIDSNQDRSIDFEEFYEWYTSEGKVLKTKMRLARLRMRSWKRLESLTGNIAERRAKLVLLKTAWKDERKRAIEEFNLRNDRNVNVTQGSGGEDAERRIVDVLRDAHDRDVDVDELGNKEEDETFNDTKRIANAEENNTEEEEEKFVQEEAKLADEVGDKSRATERYYNALLNEHVRHAEEQARKAFESKINTKEVKARLQDEVSRIREDRKRRKLEIEALSKEERENARLRAKFEYYDSDGSGSIGRDEFASMLRSLCIPMSPSELTSAFNFIKEDHSDGITFEDFVAWYNFSGKKPKSKMSLARLRMRSMKTMSIVVGRRDKHRAKKKLMNEAIAKARARATTDFFSTRLHANDDNATTTDERIELERSNELPPGIRQPAHRLSVLVEFAQDDQEEAQIREEEAKLVAHIEANSPGEMLTMSHHYEAEDLIEGTDAETDADPIASHALSTTSTRLHKEDVSSPFSPSTHAAPTLLHAHDERTDMNEIHASAPCHTHSPSTATEFVRPSLHVSTTSSTRTTATSRAPELTAPTPPSLPCHPTCPSPITRSRFETERAHAKESARKGNTMGLIDPWKFGMIKDTISNELKRGSTISATLLAARKCEFACQPDDAIFARWKETQRTMRTYSTFRRARRILVGTKQDDDGEGFDTLILLLAEVASDWRKRFTGGGPEAGARLAKICALECGARDIDAMATGVAVAMSSIFDVNDSVSSQQVRDATCVLRAIGVREKEADAIVADVANNVKRRSAYADKIDDSESILLESTPMTSSRCMDLMISLLGMSDTESRQALTTCPRLLHLGELPFRRAVEKLIEISKTVEMARKIVVRGVPNIIIACAPSRNTSKQRQTKTSDKDGFCDDAKDHDDRKAQSSMRPREVSNDVSSTSSEPSALDRSKKVKATSPEWYMREIVGLDSRDWKQIVSECPEIRDINVSTLVSRIDRLLAVGWSPVLLASLIRNHPSALCNGWDDSEEDLREDKETLQRGLDRTATATHSCEDSTSAPLQSPALLTPVVNESTSLPTTYSVERVLGRDVLVRHHQRRAKSDTYTQKSPPSLPQSHLESTALATSTRTHESRVPSSGVYVQATSKERAKRVQNRLWRIFHFYCNLPNGHATPSQLRRTHFLQFLTDCGVVKESPRHSRQTKASLSSPCRRRDVHLTVAEVDLAWSKSLALMDRSQSMSFKAFCNALTVLGLTIYTKYRRKETPQDVVADLIRTVVLPNARHISPSASLEELKTHPAFVCTWQTFCGEDDDYVRKIFTHYKRTPWFREHESNILRLREQDRGFGWDEYNKFLRDFGLSRIELSKRTLKMVYVRSMPPETYVEDESVETRRSRGSTEYRPPPLTFGHFRDLLVRLGYEMAKFEKSKFVGTIKNEPIDGLDVAAGVYRIFVTMYSRLYEHALSEASDYTRSVASWPHIEMIRACAGPFLRNFQDVTNRAQHETSTDVAATDGMMWIRRVMGRHHDIAVLLSGTSSQFSKRRAGLQK